MLTVVLALIGGTAGLWLYITAPTTLRVAVGPVGSDDVRLAAAMSQYMIREREPVRIKLILTDSYETSRDKLAAGDVDLAMLRSDSGLPSNSSTVAILRRDFVTLLAPAGNNIARVRDLDGKAIGVNRAIAGNKPLLEQILRFYELDTSRIRIETYEQGQARTALSDGRVDAVMAVAPPNSRAIIETVGALTQGGRAPVFIPILEAEAISRRFGAVEAAELVRGAFGGDPPRPSANVTTLAVTRRLQARNGLSEGLVADLAQSIFDGRSRVQMEARGGYQIESPDTERDSAIPTHPGTIAYIEGERQTFLERYGDWFYIGIMGVSLIGSVAAALWSRTTQRLRQSANAGLDRLLELVGEAGSTRDAVALATIENEADAIMAKSIRAAMEEKIDEAALSAYSLAMEQLARVIERQRSV
jgi:TRAP-type uncharacterized transport system substrate-binding protein